jgi:glycosidase
MVTVDPAVPTMGKLIKIYYDTSQDPRLQANGGLHNYTADIYAHTGVTLQGGSDWNKVIGTWGVNSTQPKLTYLGNYRYELDISPDIKTFYSLGSSDMVTKIDLVFRNAASNLQTSPDIFLNVFQTGLNVTFTLPVKKSLVAERYTLLNVIAAASLADSLSLYINKKFIKRSSDPNLLAYTIFAGQYGEFMVKAVAWKNLVSVADSFFLYVRKPIVTEALPAGVTDGINYISPTSVTLVLHATYKNYVFATGDFTGWLMGEKGYMKRTPDNERYWVTISGLIPGKEYRFQYLVDTSLYIADPYADKVLDPVNDLYITNVTYPNLIRYPKDTASGIVSVLQTSQVPYTWHTSNFQSPPKSNLVIYELLVRDFIANHDYKTLIDTLGYLQNLGINAIELMPVNEFEGNLSWGYNPSFYFAPDKYYGPKNDLKAFIDNCHTRGIALIMDIVLNHCFGQSPLVQLYIDHYATDEIIMKLPNPWFNAQSPNTLYKWGADFNHESLSTQQLVDRITSYWLTEYNIDGFRFDFTKGFTNTPGDGGAYDASRIAILKRIADQIWAVKPNAYVILEHFTANSEEKELAEYGMMPWGNMNYNFTEAAMGYASDLSGNSSFSRGWSVPNLDAYMESHDEERMMYKTLTYGSSAGSYDTKSLPVALRRMELATVFFLSVPGPKMIWQFGELGYDTSIDSAGRTSQKPIRWNYYKQTNRYRLYLVYKAMNELRRSQSVFGTNDYSYSMNNFQKRLTLNSPVMKVNILGNFDMIPGSIIPVFPQTGKWYDYFKNDSINVTNINDPINLQPGEYKLYTTKKLKSPNLMVGINDVHMQDKMDYIHIFPNPSQGEFTIEIEGMKPSQCIISVMDSSGRVIRKIKSNIINENTQLFKWDGKTGGGADAGKGLFFIQVQTSGNSEIAKVIRN